MISTITFITFRYIIYISQKEKIQQYSDCNICVTYVFLLIQKSSPGHELKVREYCCAFTLTSRTYECKYIDHLIVTLFALHIQARAHCRVAVATLNTLAGYIDWVSLVYITSGNCHLLEMLCLLLSEPDLQLEAAECLLIAISRKVIRRENTLVAYFVELGAYIIPIPYSHYQP